jgi:hypothetical protein
MTVMTDQEYENAVLEIAEQVQGEFTPFAFPNDDGDCVEFFVSPKEYYSKRVDEYLTLYLEEGTNKIAGFVVKNISRILERVATQHAAHLFVIRNGEVCLQALFTAMFTGNEQQCLCAPEYETVTDIARENCLDKIQISSILEKRPHAIMNTKGRVSAPV